MVNLVFDLQRFAEFSNNLNSTLISGTSAADTISNEGNLVTIKGGAGNDSIVSSTHSNPDLATDDNSNGYGYVTIDGGAGNDEISSADPHVSINGGAGNDSIYTSYWQDITISGGTGDDTILANYAPSVLFKYSSGDGNDLIEGFSSNSTLSISAASYSSATTSGGDVVVTVKDSGKITLVGAADDWSTGNIKFKKTSDTNSGSGSDTTSSGGNGKVLSNKTAKKSVSGTAYDDEIFNYANTVTLKGGKGNDALTTLRKTTGVKLYGEAGDDTLEAYNATKVLLSGGEGNDEIYSSGKQNTITGGKGDDSIEVDSTKTLITYADGDGNDLVEGFNSTSTLKIGNGTTDTYYVEKDGDNVIVTVGDGSITLNDAASLWVETLNGGKGGLKNIKGTFQSDTLTVTVSAATLDAGIKTADASARTAATKIVGNSEDNSIIGGSGKDKLYGKDGNDTLDGGKGNDYLHGGEGNDVFVLSAGKDTIADYTEGEDVVYIGGSGDLEIGTSISGNNGIAKINGTTVVFTNAKFKTAKFVTDNDDFEITFGAENLDNSSDSTYYADSGIWKIDASARTLATKIYGNALDNTISGGSGKDTIYGGDGTDSLFGGKGNDKLYGEDGEDTLWGGAGNDTLIGGEDDDIFVYTGGKDLIYDYVEGEDKISLNAAISDYTISGANVVLKVGSGTLTLKNAPFKEVTFIDSSGEYSKRFVDEEYTNSSAAKVTLATESKTAMANRTKAINITGNDLNNSILGGSGKDVIKGEDGKDALLGGAGNDKLYGGDEDDTLIGSLGNDSLWGGDGSDTFIYAEGDGKDTIFDFDEYDMLQITGTFTGSYNVGTNLVSIKVGSTAGAITLQDWSTSTFNINGDDYTIKGSKLVKK